MPFRFQAKYGLLTYAQCGDLDAFAIVDHLSELGAECIVGEELHADGGRHLHAFFMFQHKFRTSNARVFDVGGNHANISPGYSNPSDGYDYAIKDGNILAGGLERPGNESPKDDSKWHTITAAETESEFWALVAQLDPRSMVVSYPALRAYAGNRYRVDRIPYRNPDGLRYCTDEYPHLDEWVEGSLRINRENR